MPTLKSAEADQTGGAGFGRLLGAILGAVGVTGREAGFTSSPRPATM